MLYFRSGRWVSLFSGFVLVMTSSVGLSGSAKATVIINSDVDLIGVVLDYGDGVNIGNDPGAIVPPTLTISDGSTVAATWFSLGTNHGMGNVDVDGSGTTVSLGQALIGTVGTGTMTISGGAVVDAAPEICPIPGSACEAAVGLFSGSTGQLTITGDGSSFSSPGGLLVGGTWVEVEGTILGIPGGYTTATVEVLEGASLFSERATIGAPALHAVDMPIETAFGSVTVDGPGSTWLIKGEDADLKIGGSSDEVDGLFEYNNLVTGVVTISNGGTVIIENTDMGSSAFQVVSDTSKLIVDGAGSSLTTISPDGEFSEIVGGELLITNGGFVSTDKLVVGRSVADSGGPSNVSGLLIVDGSGSQLRLSDDTLLNPAEVFSEALLAVGAFEGGTGKVEISNGGVVNIVASNPAFSAGFTIGELGGEPDSSMTISGAGSALNVVNVGPDTLYSTVKNGSLNIYDGGQVTLTGSSGLVVGFNSGESAYLTIDGASSALTVADGLILGATTEYIPLSSGGSGTAILSNGATINADVIVDNGGFLGGSGTINGSLTNAGGTIAPGFSPGHLLVTGDLLGNDGNFVFEIGGTGSGEFDVIEVLGIAVLTGSMIDFVFIDGFPPEEGDMFDFLIADAITGLESTVFTFQGLAPGFLFDILPGANGWSFVALNDGQPVPEAGALGLVIFGLSGIMFRRRRRRSVC